MTVRFRPSLVLTIATAALFLLLVSLGVWQLERLKWKLQLIETVGSHLAAKPVSLDQALRRGADAQYRRVTLYGRFENGKEAYVFATDDAGAPVYHVIVPFITGRGALLVDRGIVLPMLLNQRTRTAGVVRGPAQITGVWRTPDPPGFFTPAPDKVHRVWYARDVASIAKADRVTLLAPVLVEADSQPNAGGWPKGGQTRVVFRNEHLQYAMTWFALAAGLIGVYLAYHVSTGRLRFRSASP